MNKFRKWDWVKTYALFPHVLISLKALIYLWIVFSRTCGKSHRYSTPSMVKTLEVKIFVYCGYVNTGTTEVIKILIVVFGLEPVHSLCRDLDKFTTYSPGFSSLCVVKTVSHHGRFNTTVVGIKGRYFHSSKTVNEITYSVTMNFKNFPGCSEGLSRTGTDESQPG